MYKKQTHFFNTTLLVIVGIFLISSFIFATSVHYGYGEENTTTSSTNIILSAGAQINNKIPIKISVEKAERIVLSTYIGEGIGSRALLGQATKISSGRWQYIWDVTVVPPGSYKVFAVVIDGSVHTESSYIVIKVDAIQPTTATTTIIEPSTNPPLSPTLSVPPSIPASPEDIAVLPSAGTEEIATISSNIEKLSNIINEDTEDIEIKKTDELQKTQDEIDAIIKTLHGASLEEIKKISDDISNTITEAQDSVHESIFTGDSEAVTVIRKDFETKTNEYVTKLENLVKTTGGVIDSANLRDTILESVDRIIEDYQKMEEAFKNEGGQLLYVDSDNDNVSDYDEINIYKTDPKMADSDNDDVSDGDEILAGTSPLSSINTPIIYADPNTSGSTTTAFTVIKVEKAETKVISGINVVTKIRFEGHALPNSFVTLFIYSSPIVVTVKTNAEGDWQYILDKELDDGNHTVFVASVDTTGKILAKNSPNIFVKQADAVELLPEGSLTTSVEAPSLISSTTIIIIVVVVLLLGALSLVFISYQHKKKEEETNKLGGMTF